MNEQGGDGPKPQFNNRSMLQPASTDYLRAHTATPETSNPLSSDIQSIKKIFGDVMEADPEFGKDIRGAGQDYDSDKFWAELSNHDNRLFSQFGKFYNSHEEFTKDSLNISLEYALSSLEQRAREREILQNGLIDPMTGLTNRSYFEKIASKRVERARKSGRQVSVLRFDTDDFKGYNDFTTEGHDHGDMVIKGIASKLLQHTRMTDDVSRLGGDENVVILYDATEEDALVIAQRIQDAIAKDESLRKPNEEGVFDRPGSVSIGITSLRGRNISLKELDSEADKAAYYSKEHGKARSSLYEAGMQGKKQESSLPTDLETPL